MSDHDQPAAGPDVTLARYHALYRLNPSEITDAVRECFTEDARFETAAADEPLLGHEAIAKRIVSISEALSGATLRHHTEVQWSHRSARWCWGYTGPSGSGRGMDIARFADDHRIELFIVFAGLLPPPARTSHPT